MLVLGALSVASETHAEERGGAPDVKRHRLGVHVAQDIPYVREPAPCIPNSSADAVSCYYAGTSDPFFHDAQRNDFIIEGFSFATTRLLLSYEFFVFPMLSVGTRVGYAFGGGPPSGQSPAGEIPEGNPNLVPAHAEGTGGSAFLPAHAELRGSFWVLPPAESRFGAYVGAGFGVAQVDSVHEFIVFDCAQTLEPSWDPSDGSFDDCMATSDNLNMAAMHNTYLDVWKKMGRGFVTATAGATFAMTSEFSLMANLNVMAMFPDSGFVLEPSLGGMYAF